MSMRLDLPPDRDLPADRRRELRAGLVRAAHQPPRRRTTQLVVVPLVVLAVLLGLGLTHPWDRTPPVVGTPSPSPVRTSTLPDRTTPASAPPVIPAATPTDRGALNRSGTTATIDRCLTDLPPRTGVTKVHFARRTSTDGDVVLFTGRNGSSYMCSRSGSSVYDGAGSKTDHLKAPDARHPVIRIFEPGLGGSASSTRHRNDTQTAYRIGPDVASLQMRVTVDGHRSPWFEASRSDEYAWAGAQVEFADTHRLDLDPDFRIEDRAFDTAGHELAIDRTPR